MLNAYLIIGVILGVVFRLYAEKQGRKTTKELLVVPVAVMLLWGILVPWAICDMALAKRYMFKIRIIKRQDGALTMIYRDMLYRPGSGWIAPVKKEDGFRWDFQPGDQIFLVGKEALSRDLQFFWHPDASKITEGEEVKILSPEEFLKRLPWMPKDARTVLCMDRTKKELLAK